MTRHAEADCLSWVLVLTQLRIEVCLFWSPAVAGLTRVKLGPSCPSPLLAKSSSRISSQQKARVGLCPLMFLSVIQGDHAVSPFG